VAPIGWRPAATVGRPLRLHAKASSARPGTAQHSPARPAQSTHPLCAATPGWPAGLAAPPAAAAAAPAACGSTRAAGSAPRGRGPRPRPTRKEGGTGQRRGWGKAKWGRGEDGGGCVRREREVVAKGTGRERLGEPEGPSRARVRVYGRHAHARAGTRLDVQRERRAGGRGGVRRQRRQRGWALRARTRRSASHRASATAVWWRQLLGSNKEV
jgi:hypothetical protein